MSRLQAFDLTKHQKSVLKKAYSDGEVDTRVVSNLLNGMDPCPVRGLELLTRPPLDPVHFRFDGNRNYDVQVASNGECCVILTHEHIAKSKRGKPAILTVRMEVIDDTTLPFLKVARPTDMQVRQLYADFLGWVVEGFEQIKKTWTEEQVELALSLVNPVIKERGPEVDRILSGEDPRVVLEQWIQGAPAPTLAPRSRRSP